MTPADLANTIAAARDGAQHLGGDGWKARQVLWEMGYRTLAVDGIDIESGIRAAERYLALWQRLEERSTALHLLLCFAKSAAFEMQHRGEWEHCPSEPCKGDRQALAQAAEKLQEALKQ